MVIFTFIGMIFCIFFGLIILAGLGILVREYVDRATNVKKIRNELDLVKISLAEKDKTIQELISKLP